MEDASKRTIEPENKSPPFWLRKLPFWRPLGIIVAIYVVSYAALMDRGSPVVEVGKGSLCVMWHSSFRFGPEGAVGFPGETSWNFVFGPLDMLYFRVFPSHRKYGDQMVIGRAGGKLSTAPPVGSLR